MASIEKYSQQYSSPTHNRKPGVDNNAGPHYSGLNKAASEARDLVKPLESGQKTTTRTIKDTVVIETRNQNGMLLSESPKAGQVAAEVAQKEAHLLNQQRFESPPFKKEGILV